MFRSHHAPNTLLTTPTQRFHSEIHIWSLLHHGAVKVVPLVGVYSTEKHPFGLVYRYMEGLDLRQYMRSKPNIGRLQLVSYPSQLIRYASASYPSHQKLIDLARGLKRMHDLGVVHGALEMVRRSLFPQPCIIQLTPPRVLGERPCRQRRHYPDRRPWRCVHSPLLRSLHSGG